MIKVRRSAIIDAPVERVWEVLRDFNSHSLWHPAVGESRIEAGEPPDRVGCVRNFFLKDGNHIREQLLGLSDLEHFSTYCILDATLPMSDYVATLKLTPVTDGDKTFAEWWAEFDCAPERERALSQQIGQGVFQAAFDSLKQRLR